MATKKKQASGATRKVVKETRRDENSVVINIVEQRTQVNKHG